MPEDRKLKSYACVKATATGNKPHCLSRTRGQVIYEPGEEKKKKWKFKGRLAQNNTVVT